MSDPTLRRRLRGLRVFAADPPPFDPASAPPSPLPLLREWLAQAIDAGELEPHAVTVSTVDRDGLPDARAVLLKDVSEIGPQFATCATSAKGRQLAYRPQAALSWYWPGVGRQVRLRGTTLRESAELAAADFRDRSLASRLMSLASRQSEWLGDVRDLETALAAAADEFARRPDALAETWALYTVRPVEVEFWQAARDRRHIRLAYRLSAGDWHRQLRWP